MTLLDSRLAGNLIEGICDCNVHKFFNSYEKVKHFVYSLYVANQISYSDYNNLNMNFNTQFSSNGTPLNPCHTLKLLQSLKSNIDESCVPKHSNIMTELDKIISYLKDYIIANLTEYKTAEIN